jgi:dCMP deaminase
MSVDRVRRWDKDYLALAKFWGERKSKDPSSKVGAVIVRPDQTVASLGYNGFPRGIEDNERRLNNRDLKYPLTIHAEMNAILTAYNGIRGYTLYTYPFLPCERCAVHVIQAGISRVVSYACPPELLERWGPSLQAGRDVFKEAGVSVREYLG